ncbi:MAG: DNA repair protein RecN (Recombination protein N) [Glaciecola sp.]|jgi:DNA repair protein RecN (Recombination protein N)
MLMLVELHIEDLALIERATLTFEDGFGVITGATGAGKSLLIDALGLLLGQRARTGLVRKGAKRALVEGRFLVDPGGYGHQVLTWLRDHLPTALEDWEEEGQEGTLELILTRSVAAEKRSQAHVNHRPVTQKMQRELAGLLVEIHGQNDQQRLFDPEEQLRLLDTFGGMQDTLQGYRERRARWLQNAERLHGYANQEAERLQRLDLLRFQVSELLGAGDAVRDKGTLLAERAKLRHAGGLGLELSGVAFGLFEADGCALTEMQKATKVLEGWAAKVPDVEESLQALHGAAAYLEDANSLLTKLLDGVESDPQRLDEIESQLVVVEHLERKYGTDAEGLLSRIEELQGELAELEDLEAGEDALQDQVSKDFESMVQSAGRLSKGRRKLVSRLQKEVESALDKLGLAGAKFCVEWVAVKGDPDAELAQLRRMYGPQGAEKMEFQLSANPGEPVAPLRSVASGGEMARIMLALRGALAVRLSTPTLIFDEVDTGVGGRLGPEVADHLARLASHHQVLCVTHLPAIAARAAGHLKVEKTTENGRTHTNVVALFGKGREMEIADMIAGGGNQKTALAEARRLLSATSH